MCHVKGVKGVLYHTMVAMELAHCVVLADSELRLLRTACC